MPCARTPGPVCAEAWALPSLNDGTCMRWPGPAPDPLAALLFDDDAGPLLPRPQSSARSTLARPATPPWRPVQMPDVGWLFNTCRAPVKGLSDAAIAAAAQTLGVDIPAIKAVAEVESSGSGFDDQGRPRILFERHYFHRLTHGRYDTTHGNISHPQWGGYGKYSAQYGRLEKAWQLEASAALQSASWGRFQIMGSHYKTLGYESPQHMVQALAQSEDEHLAAFVKFIQASPSALQGLKARDWAKFARAYNGKAYAKNQYDVKLKAAYEKFGGTQATIKPSAKPSEKPKAAKPHTHAPAQPAAPATPQPGQTPISLGPPG